MKYVIQSMSLRHGLQYVCLIGSMYRLVNWDRAAPIVHILDDVDLKNGTSASIMRTFEARDKILSIFPAPEGWGPSAPCDHTLGRACLADSYPSEFGSCYIRKSDKLPIEARWEVFFPYCPSCGKKNTKPYPGLEDIWQ
jgi:hypothetical protein